MIGKLKREPRQRHVPHHPARGKRNSFAIQPDGRCVRPDVALMMRNRALRAVVFPRCLFACLAEPQNKLRQRHKARAKIGSIRQPIVHLQIDVERVSAPPRRYEVLIPDALQVCRLCARARGCDEQIAPELKQQRKIRVLRRPPPHTGQPLGAGRVALFFAQIQPYARIERRVVFDMIALQRVYPAFCGISRGIIRIIRI